MTFFHKIFTIIKEPIITLVFPNTCVVCQCELHRLSGEICAVCLEELPFTSYEKFSNETDLDKLFWGRIEVEKTFSMLFYEKKSSVQKILHAIKYENKKSLGFAMGKLMGERLKSDLAIDCLIPIPLHEKKKFKRGYNQSEVIANGISQESKIQVNLEVLKRGINSESQTKKSIFARWDNVETAFYINQDELKKFVHVALIDDVITTGATIESCVRLIKQVNPQIKVSIISLAVTKH